jgi:hypothetical protein
MEKDLHLYQFFAITYAVWYTACQFIALKIPDFQDIYTSEDTHTHTNTCKTKSRDIKAKVAYRDR